MLTDIDRLAQSILAATQRLIRQAMPFRAIWRGTSGGLIVIRRVTETTDDAETYARIAGFTPAVGDEVVCLPISGKPVVLGPLLRSGPTQYRLDAPLAMSGASPSVAPGAAAGTGASASLLSGSNAGAGRITLTTGTGTSAGALVTVTFASAMPDTNYEVFLQAESSAAEGQPVRITGRSTTGFSIYSNTAPAASSTYQWGYLVVRVG